MSEQNPFIPVPAVYVTGANISSSNGLMRLVLFEDDGHAGHPRGCFVMTPAVATLVAELIRKQQELVAETVKAQANGQETGASGTIN